MKKGQGEMSNNGVRRSARRQAPMEGQYCSRAPVMPDIVLLSFLQGIMLELQL
jgi:hypothetical protein